jgi:hypothetical protein
MPTRVVLQIFVDPNTGDGLAVHTDDCTGSTHDRPTFASPGHHDSRGIYGPAQFPDVQGCTTGVLRGVRET